MHTWCAHLLPWVQSKRRWWIAHFGISQFRIKLLMLFIKQWWIVLVFLKMPTFKMAIKAHVQDNVTDLINIQVLLVTVTTYEHLQIIFQFQIKHIWAITFKTKEVINYNFQICSTLIVFPIVVVEVIMISFMHNMAHLKQNKESTVWIII